MPVIERQDDGLYRVHVWPRGWRYDAATCEVLMPRADGDLDVVPLAAALPASELCEPYVRDLLALPAEPPVTR